MTEQEIIELVDARADHITNIFVESDWFQEQVELAVKAYLEKHGELNDPIISELEYYKP